MFRFALLMALFLGFAAPAAAQTQSDANGIQSTITAQMEAFKVDDFAQAFSYAAPNIKGMFGTADRFGMMVKNGYPMVHRPADVRYLELRELGGRLWQKVQVQDADGTFHYLDYGMVPTEQGWQIAAVQFLPAPDVGV
ncbi:MAG: DUF4864 domain-containing protein [Pseudomonadota bacterium]